MDLDAEMAKEEPAKASKKGKDEDEVVEPTDKGKDVVVIFDHGHPNCQRKLSKWYKFGKADSGDDKLIRSEWHILLHVWVVEEVLKIVHVEEVPEIVYVLFMWCLVVIMDGYDDVCV